ncbi:type II toxin-antitoxin system mRNA interferase toxin, RelE/StbE family [Candidatus Nomurabacteria bacterium]|nr:type II toxin-antitoxin system mRNA interferase toxin, RelE/StbE family [Candidatus Nomurabacteria bacterium]
MVKTRVEISRFAEKQLKKIPGYIKEALHSWTVTVEKIGVMETRKLTGYHDEPLKGDRKGQRSIRLNRAYRAIYVEIEENILITVIEVIKHEY